MPHNPDRRPSYASGGTIPLTIARWFHSHPVTSISLVKGAENKLRFHSGSESIDHYCNWGISLTSGTDKQGRANLVELHNYAEVDLIVQWEAAERNRIAQAA